VYTFNISRQPPCTPYTRHVPTKHKNRIIKKIIPHQRSNSNYQTHLLAANGSVIILFIAGTDNSRSLFHRFRNREAII